jgi:hypothetical protein
MIGAIAVVILALAAFSVSFLLGHRPEADSQTRQEPTSAPSTGTPDTSKKNLIRFHPARQIYVMDVSATSIAYSLDDKTWIDAEAFRIEGGAWQWAAAAVRKEDSQKLAASARPRLWVKYMNDRGVESEPVEFTPKASEFEFRMNVPKVDMPTIPKIKLPNMPGLLELKAQELDAIQQRLKEDSPGNRGPK